MVRSFLSQLFDQREQILEPLCAYKAINVG